MNHKERNRRDRLHATRPVPSQTHVILAAKSGRTRWDCYGSNQVWVKRILGFYGTIIEQVSTGYNPEPCVFGKWYGHANGEWSPPFKRRCDVKRWLDCKVASAQALY